MSEQTIKKLICSQKLNKSFFEKIETICSRLLDLEPDEIHFDDFGNLISLCTTFFQQQKQKQNQNKNQQQWKRQRQRHRHNIFQQTTLILIKYLEVKVLSKVLEQEKIEILFQADKTTQNFSFYLFQILRLLTESLIFSTEILQVLAKQNVPSKTLSLLFLFEKAIKEKKNGLLSLLGK
ncbi:hypothetical protein M0813_02276 [Anaeramoeba flamelloides]|uniref:Uncharacterized protein n=1 Tax=Anaeramoeba flamelloides TaxID=1746091 RepID=A0ABQ8YKS6_9EUKA|nr:hypothetical protein M0813_02276 [Anaeramoeba flamelloides]